MTDPKILAMVMAGGRGERLYPLTRERSKPAVPVGGKYRLIDFVLSNLINSNIGGIYVLTQYKSQSLMEHLHHGWYINDPRGREFVIPVPAQMRMGESWYRGTADAIYQNHNLIMNHTPDLVAIFGADHVYRMDVRQMVEFHQRSNALVTVSAIPVPVAEASSFGVIKVDAEGHIVEFQEKPRQPAEMPDRPGWSLASMGNYLFHAPTLLKLLDEDSQQAQSSHDFGKNILPSLVASRRLFAYDYSKNEVPGRVKEEERGYWRDVGTIGAYYTVNMDFKSPDPIFNLYNREWPLRTSNFHDPPAKFVFDDDIRRGMAVHSLVGEGCILSGGQVKDSILGRNVFVHSWSLVTDSILLDGVEIGRHARIRKCIIDKNVRIPPGTVIGFNPDDDRARYHVDPDSGVVVIPKVTGPEQKTSHHLDG